MSILAQAFRKEVSKLKDNRMKVEKCPDVGYPTGFLGFDFMNGKIVHTKVNGEPLEYLSVGITDGSILYIIGRSSSGKTSWTIQAAANIIRPYEKGCIFHDDIESGVNEARKQVLTKFTAEEMEDRYIHRQTGVSAENFYQRIKMIRDLKDANRSDYEYDTGLYDELGNRIYKLQPTVYVLDSLAMLTTEKNIENDDVSNMQATANARINTSIFKRIVPLLKEVNIILMIINHINSKIVGMVPEKAELSYLKQNESLVGGKAVVYVANVLVRLDDVQKLVPEKEFGIDGNVINFQLVKSRNGASGSVAPLIFNKIAGYDPELSLFYLLKENGLVNGAGVGMYLGDRNDMKFSQKNFKDKLVANPELRQLFGETCRTFLIEGLRQQEAMIKKAQVPDLDVTADIMNNMMLV